MVRKLVCSTFYLFEYSFDGVPISAGDVSESEITAMEGGMEPRRAIDEELCVINLVFRLEFSQEPSRERGRTGRMEPHVEEFVCFRVDRRHQPVAIVVEVDHRLVEGDLIRGLAGLGLEVSLLHPIVNGGAAPIDTERIENRDSI